MSSGNLDFDATQSTEPPKKRRVLPFKRTVPRRQTPEKSPFGLPAAAAVAAAATDANKSGDDDDLDLFRRSKEVFSEVVRKVEEEEERQASLTPIKPNRKRKNHTSSSSPMEGSPSASRRISALDSESEDEIIVNHNNSIKKAKGKGKGKEVIRTPEIYTPRKPERVLRSTQQTKHTPSSSKSPVVVIDDSDDDDGGGVLLSSPLAIRLQPNPNAKHTHSLSQNLSEIISNSQKTAAKDDDDDDDSDKDNKDEDGDANMDDEWVKKALELRAKTEQETVIFKVTSRWPGTSQIKAKRRLVQNLTVVIETWLLRQLQQGADIPSDNLFATWKGQKIYDHSSLTSLGIRVDSDGMPICKPNEYGYFFDDYGNPQGVHIEVWDQELYDMYLDQKSRETANKLAVLDEEYAAESEGESPEPEERKRWKIIMKAKDLEPLRMAVKDNTTVEWMLNAFCQQRGIPNEWDVAIFFDGERLEEDSLVVDADVDDEEINQFEVHIKKN
ncbi:hypothetical protein QBC38DRAFT_364302 [Podospora fimiseda]|uniref:Rad60/SUMO-like domain-containing protein n=1 Tax=Podospora fimiseda TaxID=252190 RepID=A0AAN7GYY7_9PEZI|nr:hypothetical protein QBC38DRAFT_364302 [Podospora fimiseda]